MRQYTAGRFSATRGRKIDLFRIDLSANAINHKTHKQQLRLIVNTVANDLQFNLQKASYEPDRICTFGFLNVKGGRKELLQHDLG